MIESVPGWQVLSIAFLAGPAAFLLGGIIALAFLPRKRNRRVVCVISRIHTPACEQPPTIYAGENRRVRTLS